MLRLSKDDLWLMETELLCSDLTVREVGAFIWDFLKTPLEGSPLDLARKHGINAGMCEYTAVQLRQSSFGTPAPVDFFLALADALRT